MKKKFRMATLLCHPDKLNEKLKEATQGIFIRLKALIFFSPRRK